MILSKTDLQFYLREDYNANIGKYFGSLSKLKQWSLRVMGSDPYKAYDYLKSLRKYEYGINCLRGKGIAKTILYYWYDYKHQKKFSIYNIVVNPNTVGYGLRFPHIIGGGCIINCKSMGNYCQVNTGVIIGKRIIL